MDSLWVGWLIFFVVGGGLSGAGMYQGFGRKNYMVAAALCFAAAFAWFVALMFALAVMFK